MGTEAVNLGFSLDLTFSTLLEGSPEGSLESKPDLHALERSSPVPTMLGPWYMANRFVTLVIHKHHVPMFSLIFNWRKVKKNDNPVPCKERVKQYSLSPLVSVTMTVPFMEII